MGSSFVWTAAEAVQALRNTVGDPAGATVTRWTAAEMDDAWNRAAYQLVLDADVMLESRWYMDLTANQREYPLPADLYKIDKVQFLKSATETLNMDFIPNKVYRYWAIEDETATAAIATHYYLWRYLGDDPTSAQQPGSIHVHPTPSASTSSSYPRLRIWGFKFADSIDSGGAGTKTVEIPPVHVEAVIMYAASILMADDGDVQRSRDYLDRYERQVTKVRESLARKDLSNTSRMLPKGTRIAGEDPYDAFPRWGRW